MAPIDIRARVDGILQDVRYSAAMPCIALSSLDSLFIELPRNCTSALEFQKQVEDAADERDLFRDFDQPAFDLAVSEWGRSAGPVALLQSIHKAFA